MSYAPLFWGSGTWSGTTEPDDKLGTVTYQMGVGSYWSLNTRITYRDWAEVQDMLKVAYQRGRVDGFNTIKDQIETALYNQSA